MKPRFVLVHGAWHGGWCWRPLVPRLRAAGYALTRPTLTGVGERHHLANRDVTLDTHVADIVNHIESEELEQVILVGHSYGGAVITGVADRIAPRLAGLVYLDAFIPKNGQCMLDMMPDGRRNSVLTSVIQSDTAGPLVPSLSSAALGLEGEQADWVARRVTAQPLATFTTALRLQNTLPPDIACTYIYCCGRPTGSFDQYARTLRNDPRWRYRELDTGHDAMVTDPDGLARLLLEAAASIQ